MTREELREKVARLLCTLRGQDPDSVFYRVRLKGGHEAIRRWMSYTRAADAAIALVLEEAKEAVAYLRWQEVEPYDGRTLGAAVNALRALIPSEVPPGAS